MGALAVAATVGKRVVTVRRWRHGITSSTCGPNAGDGATTPFAALDVKSGQVIGECLPRHRAKEFLRFIGSIDRNTPRHLDLHLIVDNYATHKTEAVQAWLKKRLRVHFHFTPTSA